MRWHRVALVAAAPLLPLPGRGARWRRWPRPCAPQVVMERYYNFGGEGIATAARARDALPARGELARGRPPGLARRRRSTRLTGRAPAAALPRERMCREATALVAPLPGDRARVRARAHRDRDLGRQRGRLLSRARRDAAVRRALGVPDGAVAVLFSGSFRPWHGVHVLEEAARRPAAPRGPLLRARGRRRARARATGYRGRRLGAVPYERCRRWWPPATWAWRPTTPRGCASSGSGFYWSPLKIFEYMASGLPTVTLARPPLDRDRARRRGGAARPEADPAALAAAIERLAGGRAAAPAAGRERARARGRALLVGQALRAARGAAAAAVRRVKIVLASEVYPPRAGGAGWSTRALALGPARGRPRGDGGDHEPGARGPRRPRRAPAGRARAQAARRARAPSRARWRGRRRDVVHAQHSLSALGALAGRARRGWRSPCATTGRSASGPRASAGARCAPRAAPAP